MSGECILVIDDSKEIVNHLTQHLLPTFGYTSLHAYDGQTGLQLIRDNDPDLVMLDFNLPEITGIEVLQQMAQESLSTPVVLMTGYGSELSAIEAFRLGAKDYIIKPFTVDEIVETIDRALVETRLHQDKEELAEQMRRVKVEMSRQTNEMKTLSNIGKAITSLLSVDKILERVLEAAINLTNAEECTIWLADEDNNLLKAYESEKGDEPAIIPISGSQMGEVMQTGNPFRESQFDDEGIKIKTGYFVRAVLYVPLKLRGITLGVLGVSNVEAFRSFTKRDEFLLGFLADYAAIAFENARVFQAADFALAARLEELNTLIEITRTITSSLDLDEVVQLTIQQVHDSWNIEASSVWWVNDNRENLRVLSNVGTPSDVLTTMEVPLGQGIVGLVAETGKYVYTNDVESHPFHYRQVDQETGFHTRSLLCVPLVFRDEIVGAMQLLNKEDGDFDDQDIERALSIASAIAIAVTNALLFEAAESQETQLEVTLEHNLNPIVITDGKGHVHLLNQQARKRLHLSTDVIGKPAIDVIQPPELANLLLEDNVQPEELVLPDNSVWLPRVGPVPGNGRILTLHDITHIRELDKSKDQIVTTMSRDMRTPLEQINELVAKLGEEGELSGSQQEISEEILQTTDRMMDMVNGLLELAKVNNRIAPVNQECDLLEIVSEVVNDYQELALSKRVALVLTASPGIEMIQGNPAQLRTALSNLVDNAIKFSPRDEKIEIVVQEKDDCLYVEVQDRGDGITEEDMPHIFEEFYRGEDGQSKVSGAGLGLTLVHSIAVAHGGEIWAESHNGAGSTFILRLPISTNK